MKLSRRTFLIATGGAITLGFGAERATGWARRRPVLQWTASVAGVPAVGDLGIEYLTRTPGEDDWDVLLSRLAGLLHPASPLRGAERAAEGFNDQVRREFRDGDILRMGGWLLSRTELQLCALVALEITQRTGATGVFSPQRLPTGEDPLLDCAEGPLRPAGKRDLARVPVPIGSAPAPSESLCGSTDRR